MARSGTRRPSPRASSSAAWASSRCLSAWSAWRKPGSICSMKLRNAASAVSSAVSSVFSMWAIAPVSSTSLLSCDHSPSQSGSVASSSGAADRLALIHL